MFYVHSTANAFLSNVVYSICSLVNIAIGCLNFQAGHLRCCPWVCKRLWHRASQDAALTEPKAELGNGYPGNSRNKKPSATGGLPDTYWWLGRSRTNDTGLFNPKAVAHCVPRSVLDFQLAALHKRLFTLRWSQWLILPKFPPDI